MRKKIVAFLSMVVGLLVPVLVHARGGYWMPSDARLPPDPPVEGLGSVVWFFLGVIAACVVPRIFSALRDSGSTSPSSADRSVSSYRDGPPPGAYVLALVIVGAFLGTARLAYALVDCIELKCKGDTQCAWDDKMHIHRCVPITPAATETSTAATTSPVVPLAKPEAPRSDYERERIRANEERWKTCELAERRCASALVIEEFACHTKEMGGILDLDQPQSVALCDLARQHAAIECMAHNQVPCRSSVKLLRLDR